MTDFFYTYVWGSHGQRGAPITFTNRQNRTLAIHGSKEGDIAFGVVSRNPGDPNVQIPDTIKGRVVSAWQISHRTADTADFGIGVANPWDQLADGTYRWPFALQPIRAWAIRDAPEFRALSGYTSATHTQRAITTLQAVSEQLSSTLRDLLASSGEELEVMTPKYHAMAGLVTQLRQKHPFALKGHYVEPNADAMYHIYIATLGTGSRVLKIGHAQDAKQRVDDFNKFRLSNEKQWVLHTNQPVGLLLDAIEIEKRLGQIFARNRTEANNNEIYMDLDPMVVLSALATMERTTN